MAGRKGTDENGKLRRLPAGRHGLSREFVTRNQRERLVAGTIAAVAERGYREASVTEIAAAAGVSRRTFYSYFSDKEECFFTSYDLYEQHLFGALDEAAGNRGGWGAQVRARVATLVDFLAANPDLIRFSLLEPPSAGGEVAERGRRFVEALVARLTEGHPRARGGEDRAAVELEAMAGSISAVMISAVQGGEEAELRAMAPQLVEIVLTPFIGRRRAVGEAAKS